MKPFNTALRWKLNRREVVYMQVMDDLARLSITPILYCDTAELWGRVRALQGERYLCYYTDRDNIYTCRWLDKEKVRLL